MIQISYNIGIYNLSDVCVKEVDTKKKTCIHYSQI